MFILNTLGLKDTKIMVEGELVLGFSNFGANVIYEKALLKPTYSAVKSLEAYTLA